MPSYKLALLEESFRVYVEAFDQWIPKNPSPFDDLDPDLEPDLQSVAINVKMVQTMLNEGLKLMKSEDNNKWSRQYPLIYNGVFREENLLGTLCEFANLLVDRRADKKEAKTSHLALQRLMREACTAWLHMSYLFRYITSKVYAEGFLTIDIHIKRLLKMVNANMELNINWSIKELKSLEAFGISGEHVGVLHDYYSPAESVQDDDVEVSTLVFWGSDLSKLWNRNLKMIRNLGEVYYRTLIGIQYNKFSVIPLLNNETEVFLSESQQLKLDIYYSFEKYKEQMETAQIDLKERKLQSLRNKFNPYGKILSASKEVMNSNLELEGIIKRIDIRAYEEEDSDMETLSELKTSIDELEGKLKLFYEAVKSTVPRPSISRPTTPTSSIVDNSASTNLVNSDPIENVDSFELAAEFNNDEYNVLDENSENLASAENVRDEVYVSKGRGLDPNERVNETSEESNLSSVAFKVVLVELAGKLCTLNKQMREREKIALKVRTGEEVSEDSEREETPPPEVESLFKQPQDLGNGHINFLEDIKNDFAENSERNEMVNDIVPQEVGSLFQHSENIVYRHISFTEDLKNALRCVKKVEGEELFVVDPDDEKSDVNDE